MRKGVRISYKEFFNSIPSDIAIVNERLEFVCANRQFYEHAGLTGDAVGKNILDILPQKIAGIRIEEKIKRAIETNEIVRDHRIRFDEPKSKRFRVMEAVYVPIKIDKKMHVMILVENDLKWLLLEERYKRLIENAKDIIYIHDTTGNFTYISKSCEDLIGYKVDELLGKNFATLLTPKSLKTAMKAFKQQMRGRDVPPYEVEIIDSKGEKRTFLTSESILCEDGKVVGVQGFAKDITDKKRYEEALVAERNQLLSIFDSIEEPIYISDFETHEILYANKTIKEKFGEDIVGKKCYKVLQRRQNAPCKFCTNDKIFKDGRALGTYIWEFQNTLDGRWYRCIDRAIRWSDGRFVRFELAIDVHERKRAEEELKGSEERYKALFETTNAISSFLDADDAINAIGDEATRLLNAAQSTIYIVKGGMLKPIYCNEESYKEEIMSYSIKIGEGLTGHVAETGRAKIINYDDEDEISVHIPGTPYEGEETESIMSVPLKVKGKTIGVITVTKFNDKFSRRDMETLDLFAKQAAIVLERAEMLKRLKQSEGEALRRNIELLTLNEISSLINESLDLNYIYSVTLQKCLEVFKGDKGVLFEVDEDKLVLKAHKGVSKSYLESSSVLRLGEHTVGRVALSGSPYLMYDALKDKMATPSVVRSEKYRSLMVTPITFKGRVLGVIAIASKKKNFFTENDLELFNTIGNQIGGAVENACLYKELKDSEEKYRNLFEGVRDAVYTSDADGRLTEINQAGVELWGYKSKEELLGLNVLEVHAKPDDWKRYRESVHNKGFVKDFEVKSKTKDGRELVLSITSNVKRDGNGEVIGYEGIIRDVTEKKMVENKLSEIYKLAQEMTLTTDLDEILNICLDSMEKTLKLDNCSILLIDDEKDELCMKAWRGDVGSVDKLRLPLYGDKGITVWVVKYALPLIVGDVSKDKRYVAISPKMRSEIAVPLKVKNKTIGVIDAQSDELNAFDEDDLKLLQTLAVETATAIENVRLYDELKKSEGKYRNLVDNANDIIFALDLRGNFTFANYKATEVTGYSIEELLNMNINEIVVLDDMMKIHKKFQRRIRGEDVPAFDIDIITKSFKHVTLELNISPITMNGKVVGIQAIARDVSSLKVMQNELIESYRKLETAYEELKELDRMKTDFINIASHELRTPVVPIVGYIDLFKMDKDNNLTEKQRSYLEIIERNLERLNKLIDSMLDISRLEGKKAKIVPEKVSLTEIVEEIIEDFRLKIDEKGHELIVDLKDDLPKITADRQKLTQVFSNLISNAIKYTPENGRIEISMKIDNGQYHITVKDNGVGIPLRDQGKIFKPFYLANQSLTREDGRVGLGLAISKGNIELHGGKIWVESEEGKGSTFHVTLPLSSS